PSICFRMADVLAARGSAGRRPLFDNESETPMRVPATFFTTSVLLLGLSIALTGCARARPETPETAPTPVTVSYPIERDVTDYADFTGRTAAVDSVELRARVWGYLEKVNFKEGVLVKKGDVLFEIDPRTYEAELARSEATIAQSEARVKNF